MTYWQKITEARLGRRRLLGASGLGAGAAVLVACGGSGKSENKGPTLVSADVSTTQRAQRGGMMVDRTNFNPLNLDANASGGNVNVRTSVDPVYRQLIGWEHGTKDKPPTGKIIPEAAESWEVSPDGQTFTFKLRPQKFDPRPPTNGRQATTQDVKWSLDRVEKLHSGRALLFNSVDPDGPIQSTQVTDANTFVIKTAFSTSYLLGSIASWLSPPYLMPVEAEDKFDVRNEMRGTGPFMLTEFQADVHRKYERNPNFWAADKYPFLDGVDYINIPENAAALSQFEAGRLWAYTPPTGAGALDVLNLKRRSPQVNLNTVYNVGSPGAGNTSYFMFSDLPNSIFRDGRVRYAVSMLLDRDLALEATYNISSFEKEGVAMQSAWHGFANALWGTPKWLDPKKGELGDASKYWKHNPDEAAKLLRAAGAYGTEQTYTSYITGATAAGEPEGSVLVQMLRDGGHFRGLSLNAIDLNTQFLQRYHFGKGQFEGVAYLTYGGYPDFGLYMWNQWMPSGRNAVRNRPISAKVEELARKHRSQFDDKAKLAIEHDWQKELAVEMPSVPWPGIATAFNLTQPWLGNGGQVKTWGWPTQYESNTYYHWYDKSKDSRSKQN